MIDHRCSMVNCGKEFKVKAHLARHYAQAHGIAIRSGSPRPIMKTRTAFYLHTTGATKLSRRLCRAIIRSKKAARQPSFAINIQAVKQECKCTDAGVFIRDIQRQLKYCPPTNSLHRDDRQAAGRHHAAAAQADETRSRQRHADRQSAGQTEYEFGGRSRLADSDAQGEHAKAGVHVVPEAAESGRRQPNVRANTE